MGYGSYGNFQAWRAYVDGQLEAAHDGSDKKALWLPAKGYTETLLPTRPRAPLYERSIVDSALHRGWGFGIGIPCGVAARSGVARGRPLGSAAWVSRIAAELGLESTLRPRGRPPKRRRKGS